MGAVSQEVPGSAHHPCPPSPSLQAPPYQLPLLLIFLLLSVSSGAAFSDRSSLAWIFSPQDRDTQYDVLCEQKDV